MASADGSSAVGDSSCSAARSTSTPLVKVAPARTSATRWGVLTARQRPWAAWMSLNAIASPAARLPGPRVTLVRCRTVAKVDSGSWCAGGSSARPGSRRTRAAPRCRPRPSRPPWGTSRRRRRRTPGWPAVHGLCLRHPRSLRGACARRAARTSAWRTGRCQPCGTSSAAARCRGRPRAAHPRTPARRRPRRAPGPASPDAWHHEQVGPGLHRLPVAVSEGESSLRPSARTPISTSRHNVASSSRMLTRIGVGPHVDVVDCGQIPCGEGLLLRLPGLRQPRHRRRGQPRRRPQELPQRWHEVQRGQAMQVEQRQHLRHLRRAPAPRRQDRGGELHPLTSLVDALVVHPRRHHLDRPRRGAHRARHRVAVADHQPVTLLIELVGVGVDVGRDLGLQRRRQHPPRTLTRQHIEHRPRRLRRALPAIRADLSCDYREHGRALPTSVAAPVLLESSQDHREGTPLTRQIHMFRALLRRTPALAATPRNGRRRGTCAMRP